jgi:DNA-binding SARP family transcriptional activator
VDNPIVDSPTRAYDRRRRTGTLGGNAARGRCCVLDSPIVLRMLGSFDLRVRGEPVALSPSVERVVAYVALHDGPATRPNVAGNLWLDVPEDRAMANLRSALWRLRRPGFALLETRGDSLALSADTCVDTRDLLETARGLLDPPEAIDDPLAIDPASINRLASGTDLLGDWYDDWVLVEREHLRQIRLQALERLAVDLARRGLFGRATETALAAVATEPLRESAHRALISVHLAQGNRSEAIRQYALYRRLMREELDLEPSPQMDDLIGVVPEAALARTMRPLTSR